MMWNSGWDAWQWVGMSLMMVLFWGLVVVGIVALVRSTRSANPAAPVPPTPDDNARRILGERFARGEIDAEEYAQRRDLLNRSELRSTGR